MKKKLILAAIVSACMLFTACGSSYKNSDYAAATEEAYYEAPAAYAGEGYSQSNSSSDSTTAEQLNDTARKLIKTYNLSVETENFDQLLNSVEAKINSLQGYIQNLDTYNGNSSYRSNRYSNLTVRIPVKYLEEFVNFIGDSANVTNKTLSVEDVTMQYVDVESRKASLEIEQERLLALLERAETMEDIIALENRMSEVRYQLESMESQLRTYDNLVDYATVYLYINEVTKYTEPEPISYGERIARSFLDSVSNVWEGLKDFLVGFVGAIPGLVLFAIIVTIIVVIVKAILKGKRKKRDKKEDERIQALKALEEAKNNQN